MSTWTRIALCLAFFAALVPATAFANTEVLQPANASWEKGAVASTGENDANGHNLASSSLMALCRKIAAEELTQAAETLEAELTKTNKLLSYDSAALAEIGTQEKTGHSVCCPSFACAYGDAVLDGTVRDHGYYTCSCCSWADWGGGDSSFRCVGTDEQLLREAYDQISAGKPTVIHVLWSGGEHWITLIGYEHVNDPNHLTLANFIALDPWDGAQINAGSKYTLYGDGCEHISDR